jgi:hypothetical protein
MSNIAQYDVVSSGDAVLASVISGDFTKISAAINNNNVNSQNYSQSSILSQHINTSQVQSQHLTDGAVVSQKIADSAVVHAKVEFRTASNGVRVAQIGSVPEGASGVQIARLTKEVSQTASIMSVTFDFSAALDGNPEFTAMPNVCGNPIGIVSDSSIDVPAKYMLVNTATSSMEIIMLWDAASTATMTFHVGVQGPKG